MELKVGMYVRTINDKAVGNGVIGKIKYINEREHKGKTKIYYSVWVDKKTWFEITKEDYVLGKVKAKENIIDLIDVGDYVNGCLVTRICIDEETGKKYLNMYGSISEWENEDIKSVVTKEQMEAIKYVIE